jgi:hypothetical protein
VVRQCRLEQVGELLRISRAYGLDLGLVQRRHPLRERGLIVVEHPGVSTRKRHEMRTEFRYRP